MVDAYDFLKGQYLSQREVAEILGCSEATVRRRCREGDLARKFDGRTPRICARSVQAYLNQYTREPAQ